jgi:RNA polymerase sigma-70 factor (ECF subfamily)
VPELWEDLTPERHIEGRSVLQHVEAVIETLPPAQRAVLILRGQQELDPAEVCALLDISEGNMRVLLHRARLTVRNALDRLNAGL